MPHVINNVTNKFIVDTNFGTNKSEIGTNGKMRNDKRNNEERLSEQWAER